MGQLWQAVPNINLLFIHSSLQFRFGRWKIGSRRLERTESINPQTSDPRRMESTPP